MVLKPTYFFHTLKRIAINKCRLHTAEYYLNKYSDSTSTYTEGIQLKNANNDKYEVLLDKQATVESLETMARELWKYNIYPANIMTFGSEFKKKGELMKVNDLIFQQVFIIPKILETYCINKVVNIINTPTRKGFTYATTRIHDEIGQMTCEVELRGSELYFIVNAHSLFIAFWPPTTYFARFLQLRAHKQCLAHLQNVAGKLLHSKNNN